MPRSGGVFSLPLPSVQTGTAIEASWANTTLSDVATALTNSIAKDGSTVPTADLPLGGQKLTGAGNATARDQYPSVGQIQDGAIITIGSIAGTDTITGSLSPAITAFASGHRFQFIPAATNTGAVTIAINGLAAKAITKFGATALEAGDLLINSPATIVYDGTQYVLQNPKKLSAADLSSGTLPIARVADGAVTYAKIQDVSATDRILGRSTAGAGVVEEITCTAAGRALLDDASAAAQRTTLDVPPTTRTITAGSGLTGGGDLSANRTVTVGAGTGITVGATTVGLDTANSRNVDHSAVSVSAGNGMTGGGTIAATRTLALGTGGTVSGSSTNAVTASSHTHALDDNVYRGTLGSGNITAQSGGSPSGGSNGDVVLIY